MRIDHPGVAKLGGALDAPIVVCRHPDEWMRLLHRSQQQTGMVELAVGGVER
jgi:hypothetical protein